MKIIIFCGTLFFFNNSAAQYTGGTGRGDILSLKIAEGINGEEVSAIYSGGNGRGDIKSVSSTAGLNGEDVGVIYNGGNSRGDIAYQKNALGVNGEDVNVLYHGGSSRGDFQVIKNANGLNGELVETIYFGGNGRGDIHSMKSAQGLNSENIGVLYLGSNGRGDNISAITSGFADCDVLFFWNGTISDSWENPGNWNCNCVPGVLSVVIIPAGVLHYPLISNSTEIKSLQLQTGSSLIVKEGIVLKVRG